MKIFAHRGYSGMYPENTILAFKKALEVNVDGIELDVHKTNDNHIVVIHDETVNRTHNGHGLVKDYTLEEIRNLSCKDERFKDNKYCKIPTLKEVFELVKDTNTLINIELKNNILNYENLEEDVVKLVKKYKLEDRVILSSFKNSSVDKLNKIAPKIEVAILSEFKFIDTLPPINVIDYAIEKGIDSIHISKRFVDEEFIKKAHENNKKVRVYTVNDTKDIKDIIDLDIDTIFTDYPKKIMNMI